MHQKILRFTFTIYLLLFNDYINVYEKYYTYYSLADFI